MTYRISKSAVLDPHAFGLLVAKHASELKIWRDHMARVEADATNDAIATDQKHAPYPPPRSHPHVEEAIGEAGNPDFEIFDDGIASDQLVAARKATLAERLAAAEREAVAAVVSPGKHRLLVLRSATAHAAISNRARAATDAWRDRCEEQTKAHHSAVEEQTRGLLAKAKRTLGLLDVLPELKLDERPSPEPTAEESAILARMDEVDAAIARISAQAAEALAEIEDLTADNIDAWTLPELKA